MTSSPTVLRHPDRLYDGERPAAGPSATPGAARTGGAECPSSPGTDPGSARTGRRRPACCPGSAALCARSGPSSSTHRPGRPSARPGAHRVAGADGVLGQVLLDAAHVGDDLGPDPALGAAADRDAALAGRAGLRHRLQQVSGAVRGGLEQCPVQLAACGAQRQSGDDAAGMRVADRGPLPGEVGQRQQAVRAGRDVLGLLGQDRVLHPTEEVAQPVVSAPLADRPPARQNVSS